LLVLVLVAVAGLVAVAVAVALLDSNGSEVGSEGFFSASALGAGSAGSGMDGDVRLEGDEGEGGRSSVLAVRRARAARISSLRRGCPCDAIPPQSRMYTILGRGEESGSCSSPSLFVSVGSPADDDTESFSEAGSTSSRALR
jgi:hypothetical protein